MRDLLPDRRFAQLVRLTRKALRVYAEAGLSIQPLLSFVVHIRMLSTYIY